MMADCMALGMSKGGGPTKTFTERAEILLNIAIKEQMQLFSLQQQI
jgi:hypothetical protein